MQNPIPQSSLFRTPASLDELQEIAESMSNKSEAWRMMVFTLNFCHSLVNQEPRRTRVISKGHNGVHDPEADAEEQFGRAGL